MFWSEIGGGIGNMVSSGSATIRRNVLQIFVPMVGNKV
jgi:hypothetical protein